MPKRLRHSIRLDRAARSLNITRYQWLIGEEIRTLELPKCLDNVVSFRFEGSEGTFTARRETKQRGGTYWYAYLVYQQKQHKLYIGKTDQITVEQLEETAKRLYTLAGKKSW